MSEIPKSGSTLQQMMENGRKVAEEIQKGNIPPGTVAGDWVIINGVAIYRPVMPLLQTPLPS